MKENNLSSYCFCVACILHFEWIFRAMKNIKNTNMVAVSYGGTIHCHYTGLLRGLLLLLFLNNSCLIKWNTHENQLLDKYII